MFFHPSVGPQHRAKFALLGRVEFSLPGTLDGGELKNPQILLALRLRLA